jgi:hypothetical protein
VSKFQSLLDVAKNREAAIKPKRPGQKKQLQTKTSMPTVVEIPRRGRPAGKRSDPDYEQVTAYIRKHTHKDVKIALLQEGQGREFSELIEELLSGWLQPRT